MASVGINGCSINNVNADARVVTPAFLPEVARIADAFRPWGVRMYISLNFASPRDVDLLVLPAASLSGRLVCSDRGTMPAKVSFRIFPAGSRVENLWQEKDLKAGASSVLDDVLLRGDGADRFQLGPLSPDEYHVAARPDGQVYWSWASNELVPDRATVFPVAEAATLDTGLVEIECGPLVAIVPELVSKEPVPDLHLGVGSGSHGVQTGAVMAALDPLLAAERPDWVLVYGDTNSTLAGALAAVKLHLAVAHLEAGLRSFNRRMPEEHNRVLTDHCADLLLAPTQVAMQHLADEGLASRAVLVGDVMTDVCLRVRDAVTDQMPDLPEGVRPAGPGSDGYLVATVHRAENTDDPDRLRAVLDALAGLDLPVVLLAHPRLAARCAEFGLQLEAGALRTRPPMSYPQTVAAVVHSRGVVTDSGGLQKEAFLLGVPCTTVRTETEWVETLQDGWNVLDPSLTLLPDCAARPAPTTERAHPYGTGDAATAVVAQLRERLQPGQR
jgi:UDP-N-acetylglucosamine 2-epimerase (non-hydrolysing)